MPALGLGTWQLTGRACQEAVETALELGYRHLDTAQMYGPDVRQRGRGGAGIAASGLDPAELFVTTKIASDVKAPAQLRASAEASLDRLGLEGVDLLLLHQPVPDRLLASALAAVPLLAIQLEYHPFHGPGRPARRRPAPRPGVSGLPPLARGGATEDPGVTRVAARRGQARPRSCCGGCSTSREWLPSPRPPAAPTWRRTGRPRPSSSTTMPGCPRRPPGSGAVGFGPGELSAPAPDSVPGHRASSGRSTVAEVGSRP